MADMPQMTFTVTAGRTGTTLLQKIFSIVPDAVSEHEARPDFVRAMRKTQSQPFFARRFILKHKLPAIKASGAEYYIETSHLFCKGFLEPMLELAGPIGLVFLRRPASEIAYSLLSRKTVPIRTQLGQRYLLQPGDPGTLEIDGDPKALSDYQLCYWYALEIERRQAHYQRLAEEVGLPRFLVETKQLTDADTFFCNVRVAQN